MLVNSYNSTFFNVVWHANPGAEKDSEKEQDFIL